MKQTFTDEQIQRQASLTPEQASKEAGIPVADVLNQKTPLNSNVLSNTQTPVTIPTPLVSNVADGITGQTSALVDQAKEQAKIQADLEAKQAEAQAKVDESRTTRRSLMDSILGVESSRPQVEGEFKIAEKSQKYTDITNQIEASQRAQTNELRALDNSGLTDVQKSQQTREINRKYAFEQADLAVIQSAANRDLLTAQSLADRKIQLQLEPLKMKLDFEQQFYQENKDLLDVADKRAFENLIKQSERDYNKAEETAKTLQDTKLALLKSASEQGASSSILSAIQSAKTPEDAITSAGIYSGDVLANQVKKLQLQKLQKEVSDLISTNNVVDANAITDPNLSNSDKNTLVLDSVLKKTNIGAGTKTQIANVLGVVNALNDLANQRVTGEFSGFYPGANIVDFITPSGFKRQQTIENESYLDAINLRTQIWASGASLTKDQIAQVNRITPRKGDTDAVIRTKMNTLSNFMLTQAKTQLQSEGVKFEPTKVDLFETASLLQNASEDQLNQLRVAGLIQ